MMLKIYTKKIIKLLKYKRPEYTLILDLTLDLDVIWKNIKKTRRHDIRKGDKENIKIIKNKYQRDFKDMLDTLRSFLELPPHRFNSYEENFVLFVAVDENNNVLSGTWYRIFKKDKRIRSICSASKRYIPELKILSGYAHALQIWEVIKWSKNNNLLLYDFGGYSIKGVSYNKKDVRNINFWKKSFGGKLKMIDSGGIPIIERTKRLLMGY